MRPSFLLGAATIGAATVAAVVAGHALAGGRDQHTAITIKRSGESEYGGEGYGAAGAFVTQRRDVEIGADGALRFPGVAAALDAATVELRSVTDPAARVVEQRLVNDLVNPEALLFRQLGKPIEITLTRGEVKGVLRAMSSDAFVVETADKAVQIVQRGPQIVDVKLAAAAVDQDPTLEWRVATARPGRHTVEVSYRTEALSWAPEYAAILGEGDTVDLSAWANVTNEAGVDFVEAEITLAGVGGDGIAPRGGVTPSRPLASQPPAWKIPRPVTIKSGQSVQLELAPRKTGAKARRAIVYEALREFSGDENADAYQDCDGFPTNERIREYLELDGAGPLPDGRVRLLRRTGAELVSIGEDVLRAGPGNAIRISTGSVDTITGARSQTNCQLGANGRSLEESIEIEIENNGKQPVDVVVREYLYRWHNWKMLVESEKGARAGARAQEYRVRVPAGGTKTVSYSVRYTW